MRYPLHIEVSRSVVKGSGIPSLIFKEIACLTFSLMNWYSIFSMIVNSLYFLKLPYYFAILRRSVDCKTFCGKISRHVHVLLTFWRQILFYRRSPTFILRTAPLVVSERRY